MFNNNKKEKPKSMSVKSSAKKLPSVNMISEGTQLKGTLETKNDVRIAGTLSGEAKAEGKVIVSETGKVEGNIEAKDADIGGHIDGEVRVTDKLVLRKSAIVEGDIYTKTIQAEEGARINGSFHMNQNVKDTINSSLNGRAKASSNQKESTSEKVKEK